MTLGLLLAFAPGCPGPRQAAPAVPETAPEPRNPEAARPEQPVDKGAPSTRLGEPDAPVHMRLPEGWTARGDDAPGVLGRAWSATGTELELRRWDGSEAGARSALDGDPQGWVSEGPYASIPAADGPTTVATWREDDGERVGLGWFFTVQGQPVALLARVSAESLERGWDEALGVVVTAEVP